MFEWHYTLAQDFYLSYHYITIETCILREDLGLELLDSIPVPIIISGYMISVCESTWMHL